MAAKFYVAFKHTCGGGGHMATRSNLREEDF